MDAKRLAEVENIYHAVREVAEEEWPSFLTNSCGNDNELRHEVESLLSFADRSLSLIDIPPLDVAAEVVRKGKRHNIIGKRIKHYKILSQLGTGGMGDVFLATDTALERQVAIKFVSAQFAQGTAGLRRFMNEARTASALNHPNIITVHEVGKTRSTPFIASEYIDGITVREAINNGDLTPQKSLDIIFQTASALASAHSAGIFHRDIKPENIMVRKDGLVKVLDFGLAKAAGTHKITSDEPVHPTQRDLGLSVPGLVMGTLAYMSPEQAEGKPVDGRSDIWSLGVVMYEVFSGQKPFDGNTAAELIESILNSKRKGLSQSLPAGIRQIIEKCLQKDPANRYQNAAELQADVRYQQSVGSLDRGSVVPSPNQNAASNSAAISSAEYVVLKVGQHKIFAVGVFASIIALISIAGYFYQNAEAAPVRAIAVMPFENESVDSSTEYLSDGMSEGIINRLSQVPGLKVISRDSSFKYKGQKPDIQQVARELGVQAVITGRVAQRDGRLLVSAELINASDNTQVWGGRFDRGPTNMQQVQGEILRQIIDKMGLRLSAAERVRFETSRDIDPRAYELFLKGSFYRSIGSEDGANKAADLYQQALAIDASYAEAFAALARTYLYLGANGFKDQREMAAKAEIAAKRALELDDSNAEVHLAIAEIKKTARDWAGADLEFKRAAELNPNLASVHFSYSFFLVTQGRNDEAISEAKLTRELDPLRRNINLEVGFIYYLARQYDAALEHYNTGVEIGPDNGPAYYGRGLTYAALGRHHEALADYREMQRLSGDFTGLSCYIGVSLAKIGRVEDAKAVLKGLETGKKYVSPVELAILYTALGEREKALTSLERGYAERDSQIQFLGVEPNFESIHSEVRFAALMRKVGFEK